jgi:hypothetical protein
MFHVILWKIMYPSALEKLLTYPNSHFSDYFGPGVTVFFINCGIFRWKKEKLQRIKKWSSEATFGMSLAKQIIIPNYFLSLSLSHTRTHIHALSHSFRECCFDAS